MCWRWEWAGSTGERRGSGWQGEDLAGDGERVGQVFPKARCSKAPGFPMGQEKNMALGEATTREMSKGKTALGVTHLPRKGGGDVAGSGLWQREGGIWLG